jgi:P-type Cu2+ transporter
LTATSEPDRRLTATGEPDRAPLVEVVHALPGRVRLRVPLLRGYPSLAEALIAVRPAGAGLRGVRVNAACASVVVEAASAEVAARHVRARVAEWLVAERTSEAPARPAASGDLAAIPGRLARTTTCAAGLVGLGLTFVGGGVPQSAALAITALGSLPTVWRAGAALVGERRPSADQLDAAAMAIMFLAGDVRGAALSRVVASLAAELRDFTARRSRRVSVDLRGALGNWAWALHDGQRVAVPVDGVADGDLVVVHAREPIPVDGVVEAGAAWVNQRALTGEGRPIEKSVGDTVYAATLVTQGWLNVRANAVGRATRAGWVVQTLERLPARDTRAADYAAHYVEGQVLPAFGIAGLTWAATRDAERAAAVLNVDYGTGIEISAPTSILASMAHAAQDGILIKSGGALERLALADTVVLDKTGTLTHGRPEVTEVVTLVGEMSTEEVLSLAAAAEGDLRHVVARAIRRRARRQGLVPPATTQLEHVARQGVIARVNDREVRVGNVRFLTDAGIPRDPATIARATALGEAGNAIVYVVVDGQLVGLLAYQDAPRRESAGVVGWLRGHGVPTVHLVTGDARFGAVPAALAAGIAEADLHYNALPEDKAAVVEALQRAGRRVAFVGDGIDDAPALAMADVSISFLHGADAAQATADVVLLDRDLRGLVHAIELSRASLGIIRQNLRFVRLSNFLIVALAVVGRLDPAATALFSTGGAALVEVNSLRPLLAPHRFGRHHLRPGPAHGPRPAARALDGATAARVVGAPVLAPAR